MEDSVYAAINAGVLKASCVTINRAYPTFLYGAAWLRGNGYLMIIVGGQYLELAKSEEHRRIFVLSHFILLPRCVRYWYGNVWTNYQLKSVCHTTQSAKITG